MVPFHQTFQAMTCHSGGVCSVSSVPTNYVNMILRAFQTVSIQHVKMSIPLIGKENFPETGYSYTT